MMTLNELYNELLNRYSFLKKFYTLEITQDVNCAKINIEINKERCVLKFTYELRLFNKKIFLFEKLSNNKSEYIFYCSKIKHLYIYFDRILKTFKGIAIGNI